MKLPIWVEIDLDRLVGNLKSIRHRLARGVQILLTVKADAYGHGAVQIASAAKDLVDCFGVATVDEALEMTYAGIEGKILILSPILADEVPIVVDNGFAVTVSSIDLARSVSGYSARQGMTSEVHIEIDTGMGRTGVFPGEAETLVRAISRLPGIRLGGLFTHFPVSDTDADFTRYQVKTFVELVDAMKQAGVAIPLVHSANSAAIPTVPESHLQMVRPGLLAYGHLPDGTPSEPLTEPILSWKTRIVQLRRVPVGHSISYGRTFTTVRETTMGVVPVGYGHGYPLRLSGRGGMIVRGQHAPILGRVTMDMTMIDLTDVSPPPEVGDEVVLVGHQDAAAVTVDDIASWAGTISYEVLCGISKRVPRLYLRDGKVETYKSLLGVSPTVGT